MKSLRFIFSVAALVLIGFSASKAEAADTLQITVNASVDVISIDWDGAGDVAGKSWSPVITNWDTDSAAQGYTINNRSAFPVNLEVSASDAGSTWKLATATGNVNDAVLKSDATVLQGAVKAAYNGVAAGGNQAISLVLKSPVAGSSTTP